MGDAATLDTYGVLSMLRTNVARPSLSSRWKDRLLLDSFQHPLDRVNVLGDHERGHTGCVNALSWARDGELLLSGGDDTTVRVWRMDSSNASREYPFVCDAVIRTGHRANIFNVQMLPHSSRIVSVAGDKQVRVSDIRDVIVGSGAGKEVEYSWRQAGVQVLRCHSGAVKRITTEDSPALFLTVSEDGSIRQHDLRVSHNCLSGPCPAPLVKVNHSLCTMSMSPLTPYQFVAAGESPYGYLFDRRQLGRHLQEEWGMPPDTDRVTTCVRKFGRLSLSPNESQGFEHVTGCRMATSNGHEVLLSYSADAVYIYSTRDDALGPTDIKPTSVLPSNSPPTSSQPPAITGPDVASLLGPAIDQDAVDDEIERIVYEQMHADRGDDEDVDVEDYNDDEGEESDTYGPSSDEFPSVPVILPRGRYAGICNVETVKDVNFLGPRDEFVVSGSDDGHFFIWNKATGQLHDILEGDGHVVNVVESHPHLPVVAVSGIDTTVKLFAPAHGESSFSRIRKASSIMDRNADASSRRIDLTSFMIYSRIARRVGINDDQCRHQ